MTGIADPTLARRNARLLAGSLLVVAGMIGLSFAAVPLYDLFCRVTGFGGTTQVASQAPSGEPGTVLDRSVRVRFLADTARDLPWQFSAAAGSEEIRIGEAAMAFFTARNEGDEPVAGTAVYNVTPPRAGLYFFKTQCFCFDEQIIEPGREVTFPVLYHVDPSIADDPQLDGLAEITLSYTFYPTTGPALDRAIEDFRNRTAAAAAGS